MTAAVVIDHVTKTFGSHVAFGALTPTVPANPRTGQLLTLDAGGGGRLVLVGDVPSPPTTKPIVEVDFYTTYTGPLIFDSAMVPGHPNNPPWFTKLLTPPPGSGQGGLRPPPPRPPGSPLTIGYTGTISAGLRDPSALFAALAWLGERRVQVRLVFYGAEPATLASLAARHFADGIHVKETVERIVEPGPALR